MEEKFNKATTLRPEGERPMDAALVKIDIPSFIENIRNEKQWKDSDRNAITVFKTNGLRIVLMALHKDAEMTEHSADGLIGIQMMEGRMIFKTEEQSVELSKGQMIALHEGIPHSILAKEETIFLLTLTTTLAEK
ncbi:MAG: hypothetical protein JJE25_10490 [Bacteroidia bacterium]|nr:hypothetical protein [Bacteroidia bacterium]